MTTNIHTRDETRDKANTIEELRAANERWAIAFKQAEEERAKIVALAAEWMGDIEFAQFKHAIEAL